MKLIRYIFLIFAIGLLSSGCTQNNGDIGDLFGNWRLDSVTAEGLELELYDGEIKVYTWAFQSGIIRIQKIYSNMDHLDYLGTWQRDDDELTLNFTHHADYGDENFTPPEELHLVAHGITRLDILQLNSSKMCVGYRGNDGVEYKYYLHKVP